MLPHLARPAGHGEAVPQRASSHKGFIEKNVPRHAPDWIKTVTLPRKGTDRWGKAPGRRQRPRDDRVRRRGRPRHLDVVGEPGLGGIPHADVAGGAEGPAPLPRPPRLRPRPGSAGRRSSQCCQVALRLRERAGARRDRAGAPRRAAPRGCSSTAPSPPSAGRPSAPTPTPTPWPEELEETTPISPCPGWRSPCASGKVLIDWSQNNTAKTTVSPYSLRAVDGAPGVDPAHLGRGRGGGRARREDTLLGFSPQDVLERVETKGDLFESLAP